MTGSRVAACEQLGPYMQVRLERTFAAGEPGQFHMLRALAHDSFLARPLSAVASGDSGVTFLCQPRGPALAALAQVGAEVEVLGPFGQGFDARSPGPRPAAGRRGIRRGTARAARCGAARGSAARGLPRRGGRAGRRARAVPGARDRPSARQRARSAGARLAGSSSVFAAGPDGLVRAVAAACVAAGASCQIALEAPMACGYGACYGCAVRLGGELVRLCVEGPVVSGERVAAA